MGVKKFYQLGFLVFRNRYGRNVFGLWFLWLYVVKVVINYDVGVVILYNEMKLFIVLEYQCLRLVYFS